MVSFSPEGVEMPPMLRDNRARDEGTKNGMTDG